MSINYDIKQDSFYLSLPEKGVDEVIARCLEEGMDEKSMARIIYQDTIHTGELLEAYTKGIKKGIGLAVEKIIFRCLGEDMDYKTIALITEQDERYMKVLKQNFEKGREEGREQGILSFYDLDVSINKIAKAFEISVKEVQEVLRKHNKLK